VGPRAGLDTEEKRKIYYPCGQSKPGYQASSLVPIPTELSRPLLFLMLFLEEAYVSRFLSWRICFCKKLRN
jgi:hypothetical protein